MISLSAFDPEFIDGTSKYNITQILTFACEKYSITKKSKIDLWLRKNSTKEAINDICSKENIPPARLIFRKRGRFGGGTWVHPKLAKTFVAYLNDILSNVA